MAVGAAQSGLRPVVEHTFVDFAGVGFDQILNQMAKNHFMSGGRVRLPLVLRAAVGCIGSAAQHSQVLSATFAHIPGLKVAYPGSHGDLQGLLVAAIRDDSPVVFLEHKLLYRRPGISSRKRWRRPAGSPARGSRPASWTSGPSSRWIAPDWWRRPAGPRACLSSMTTTRTTA
jgi:pyruvate/2-oxoglutarate/acetoin dehydrogenase E1 component